MIYHNDAAIIEFLGDFYIRYFLFSKKSDVPPFLTMFKKFAAFCLHQEQINKETYDTIMEVCKKKDFFYHRFDTYMKTNDLLAWEFENDPDLYEYELEEQTSLQINRPLPHNKKLLNVLQKHNIETASIVPIFRHVVERIAAVSSIKTSATRPHFARPFWLEVGTTLGLQLFKRPSLNQEDIPLYQFIYQVLVHTGAVQLTTKKAAAAPCLHELLALSDMELLSLLLDCAWSHIPGRTCSLSA